MGCRRPDVHPFHVLLAFFDIALGNLRCRDAFLVRLFDNLVIHVGKVRNVVDFVTLVFKIASQCIEDDHRPGIPDVNEVVDGRSADIHRDLSRRDRDKFLSFFCQCVVKKHGQSPHRMFDKRAYFSTFQCICPAFACQYQPEAVVTSPGQSLRCCGQDGHPICPSFAHPAFQTTSQTYACLKGVSEAERRCLSYASRFMIRHIIGG